MLFNRAVTCCFATSVLAITPANAQTLPQASQVVESSVGKVGRRQTRDQAPANIEPMARINSRIANRIQNRTRNRIDRDYGHGANATSAFVIAADQINVRGRR